MYEFIVKLHDLIDFCLKVLLYFIYLRCVDCGYNSCFTDLTV